MEKVVCIAIITVETPLSGALGKKRLSECALDMQKASEVLYECKRGHKRYYPYDRNDLRAKMTGITKDGVKGYY